MTLFKIFINENFGNNYKKLNVTRYIDLFFYKQILELVKSNTDFFN